MKNNFGNKHILCHGYQGGFYGVNCNKIFQNLDDLEIRLHTYCPSFIPVITCMKDFKKIVHNCFSKDLNT